LTRVEESLEGRTGQSPQEESTVSTAEEVQEMFTTPMLSSDVILAIHPSHMAWIMAQETIHNFSRYCQQAETMRRIWIYVMEPVNTIKYLAIIHKPSRAGATPRLPGLGNEDSDLGIKKSKFGNALTELYELSTTMWMGVEAKENWQFQGLLYPTEAMIKDWRSVDLIRII
jgi:hypothetical protein